MPVYQPWHVSLISIYSCLCASLAYLSSVSIMPVYQPSLHPSSVSTHACVTAWHVSLLNVYSSCSCLCISLACISHQYPLMPVCQPGLSVLSWPLLVPVCQPAWPASVVSYSYISVSSLLALADWQLQALPTPYNYKLWHSWPHISLVHILSSSHVISSHGRQNGQICGQVGGDRNREHGWNAQGFK